MIRMENSAQSGSECWIPSNNDSGTRDSKTNMQYTTNTSMYNTPCSVYNVPTITLPTIPSQTTYIIDNASSQQANNTQQQIQQQPQTTVYQNSSSNTSSNNNTGNKQEFLKCSHWPDCKFYTSNPTSLKNHELTHFAQQPLHTCPDCNLHFTTKSSKDEHVRRKHKTWAKIYSCSHCNFETSVLDEFSEHNVAYHLDSGTCGQIYQCHQCNYSTSWKCFMDSHMLVHSINDLDYRPNKKPKFSQFSTTKDTASVITSIVTSAGSGKKDSLNVSQPNNTITTATNKLTSQTSSALTDLTATLSASQQQQISQNIMVSSQQINTTLANIAPMPVSLNNTILTQLTTLHSSPQNQPYPQGGQVKPEYRCNMCHHFATTCSSTFHQHIKSHNTCQQCGYSSNNITDLSLHVCHSYDGGNTYTNILNNTTGTSNSSNMNFGGYNNTSNSQYNIGMNNTNNTSPTRQKNKRSNRAIVDDDFQPNIYRCRKCDYGTSWKCFLDSHMLTHATIN